MEDKKGKRDSSNKVKRENQRRREGKMKH